MGDEDDWWREGRRANRRRSFSGRSRERQMERSSSSERRRAIGGLGMGQSGEGARDHR